MGADSEGDAPSRSDALGERIRKAQAAEREQQRPAQQDTSSLSAAALAWRMFADLLAGILVGFGFGWSLDAIFGTMPVFLTVVGLLGMAGGIRLAIRTAREANGERNGGKIDR